MLIRHATADDASGCLEVYAPFANDTAISFEHEAPSLEDYSQRIVRVNRTHAFLVAEDESGIAGFAYAGVHRERLSYRWTCEVSVYLGPTHRGHGLGRKLYTALFALLEQQGYRMLLAGITMPNSASVALHRSLGFEEVGVYRRIGWKAGAWRDVMWLARRLGGETHETELPPPPGPPARLPQPIKL
ncbi:MAG TPA: GNAT family N-acetyltransferase [Solirubrobacteraceae bacterium]|jgi:phosphinothricin acetyltransferase|nr:GNAT family N-acetyltransferase [Solirubrobacteraceae bacterium]